MIIAGHLDILRYPLVLFAQPQVYFPNFPRNFVTSQGHFDSFGFKGGQLV